ncbi:MAG: 4Fe-4S binding protein [Halanaerobium sp.]
MVIFSAGLLISLAVGRLYCSWACPMNTLMRPISWIYKKFNLNRFKGPDFMRKSWFRWLILTFVVVLMAASRQIGLNINIILYLTVFSVIFSLFFEEALWHKSVCPFGTVLSVSEKAAKFGLQVDKGECISCSKCEAVCTNNTILVDENNKREIVNNDCLLCFKCEEACPTDAISYKNL